MNKYQRMTAHEILTEMDGLRRWNKPVPHQLLAAASKILAPEVKQRTMHPDVPVGLQRCGGECKGILPLDAFAPSRQGKSGNYCKARMKNYMSGWRANKALDETLAQNAYERRLRQALSLR